MAELGAPEQGASPRILRDVRRPSLRILELFSIVQRSFWLLSGLDRRKLTKLAIAQIALSLLDLLGIALVGLVTSLAVNGVNSKSPNDLIVFFIETLGLEKLSFQLQTAILSTITLLVFVLRTVLSVVFVRRVFLFLGRRGADIAADLCGKVLNGSILDLGKHGSQQYIYSLTSGIEVITLRILGTAVTLASDFVLLGFIFLVIAVVNFPMTVLATLVVSAAAYVLHELTTKRSKQLGSSYAVLDIKSREALSDAFLSIKEVKTKGRVSHYEIEFRDNRRLISNSVAEYNFFPFLSKYVIEASMILAAFLVAGAQLVLTDAVNAITTLTIFMAAGTRLAPAVLRIQQAIVSLNNSWGVAESTLDLIHEVEKLPKRELGIEVFSDYFPTFKGSIEMNNVSFSYPLGNGVVLKNLSLNIEPGESIALVGPSGSGKTTLIDLMMGLLIPDNGNIRISGMDPTSAILKWPGSIGYVPQEIHISNSSVRGNVALGYKSDEIDQEKIWDALKSAQMDKFVMSLPLGLDTKLGPGGMKLSGGQKQRLGIARALLTKPKILFLDEATSALDSRTEFDVAEEIQNLKGDVTLVCIAHRLSTAKRADRVFYLEDGKLIAQGSFDHLRSTVPGFQNQIELYDL